MTDPKKGHAWPKEKTRWHLGANHIGDYMHRWILETPWFSLRIHHILRSDEDRALHDHPWNFASLILWGGYFEVTQERDLLDRTRHVQTWHGPLSLRRLRAETLHRVVIPEGRSAWTVVWTGPILRKWGFLDPEHGWLYWRKAKELWGGQES